MTSSACASAGVAMTGEREFRTSYSAALLRYVARGDEASRRAAYELGREAVTREIGVLDVADAHHEGLLEALWAGAPPENAARAAGDFLLDVLSAYEMVQRALGEAREAARRDRRHAAMLRRLSTFLADASLTLVADEPIHEVLNLLADQARELTGGACSVATVSAGAFGRPARAASYAPEDPGVGARLALADLSALEDLAPPGSAARRDPAPFLDAFDGMAPVRSWIAAPMARLDGSPLGCLHVFEVRPHAFGPDHEAVLLHIAQMGSAAVERVQLYAAGAGDAADGDRPR
jgi:GAF domain-containing protein